LYSLRVGAYRILYQLTDGGKTVRVAALSKATLTALCLPARASEIAYSSRLNHCEGVTHKAESLPR